ncbi:MULTISPECIES: hypothetical protein [Methylomonas]|uniref:hypothetical protein n=1 Tax=Methylomonas TaxID=416 RepID=UPI001681A736|nr:hypothetical protein [Methylomonas rhizoryzae]
MRRLSVLWKLKWLCVILVMMTLDFSPFPVSALLFLYIFLFKPLWFKAFVERLYE